MKNIILIITVFFTNYCSAQKIIPSKCHSYIDELIEKKPLPERMTNDQAQYDAWRLDNGIKEAVLFNKGENGAIYASRMFRFSADSVFQLQRAENLIGDSIQCTYSIDPFNPTHPEYFRGGNIINGNGEKVMGIGKTEDVKKMLSYFK